MKYRMIFLGVDARGRLRFRGTGACQEPGGITECLRFYEYIKAEAKFLGVWREGRVK